MATICAPTQTIAPGASAPSTTALSSTPPAPAASRSTTSPPYWSHHRNNSTLSTLSSNSIARALITLEDHTEEQYEQNSALWARKVDVTDFTVVKGSRTGVGAYVVWTCTVDTLDGGKMIIRKRYSEFDDLRRRLLQTFPQHRAAMPPLPPKSFISKFREPFLDKRRIGLSYFLNCVILNPEFSGSPVLREFLFD